MITSLSPHLCISKKVVPLIPLPIPFGSLPKKAHPLSFDPAPTFDAWEQATLSFY
jgi:hypothetical protein